MLQGFEIDKIFRDADGVITAQGHLILALTPKENMRAQMVVHSYGKVGLTVGGISFKLASQQLECLIANFAAGVIASNPFTNAKMNLIEFDNPIRKEFYFVENYEKSRYRLAD